MIKLPSWYHTLSQDPQSKEFGFTFLTEEEISDNQPSEFFFGKIRIADSIQLPIYKMIMLWFDPEQPETLWFSFDESSESPFMIFPVKPEPESLKEISDQYLVPAGKIPDTGSVIVNAARIRKAEPIQLASESSKEYAIYIGNGDWYDTMVSLENAMEFNPYLSHYTICLATAENTDGPFTQKYTAFSASLFSIFRMEIYGTTFYYAILEYEPTKNHSFVQHLKQTALKGHPMETFPDDIPLDVIGAVYSPQATYWPDKEKLIKDAHEGDFNSLLYLSGMTFAINDFEEVFTPFASHPDEKFRSLVAEECYYRESPELLEIVIQNGIRPSLLEKIRNSQ